MLLINFLIIFLIGFFFAKFKLYIKIFIFFKYQIIFKLINLFTIKKKLNLSDFKRKINIDREFKSLEFFLKKNYNEKKINSKSFFLDAIGQDKTFKQSVIKKNKILKKYILRKEYILKVNEAYLKNELRFKWIEFYKKNCKIKKNLLFLHGNSCDPGEIFGLRREFLKYSYQRFADPVGFVLSDYNTRIIMPIKFDLYFTNNFHKASLELNNKGLNINFIEQIKILALKKYFKKNISLFGFSHGAWQSLISSQISKFDNLIYFDFLVNPIKFNLKRGFYKDFKFGFKNLFNYAKAFKYSKSKKIILMIGKKSPIYDKKFVNYTLNKIKRKNLTVKYFDDKHYISLNTIKKYLLDEK